MEPALEARLAAAVLDRLELDRPAVDSAGLRAVYRSWCDHISFDNLQKLVGLRQGRRPLPGDDSAEFFDNWLHDGTGATCWASSNALHDLLAYLGFEVTRLTAAMLDLPDPNHATNLVDVDGTRFLVDSSVLSGEPIEVAAERTEVGSSGYRVDLTPAGATWVMTFPSVFVDRLVCRVFPGPSDLATYQRLHEMTRESGPFNHQLYVTCHRDGSVWNLHHRTLTRLDSAHLEQTELSEDDTRGWLAGTGFSGRIVAAALGSER